MSYETKKARCPECGETTEYSDITWDESPVTCLSCGKPIWVHGSNPKRKRLPVERNWRGGMI